MKQNCQGDCVGGVGEPVREIDEKRTLCYACHTAGGIRQPHEEMAMNDSFGDFLVVSSVFPAKTICRDHRQNDEENADERDISKTIQRLYGAVPRRMGSL